MHDVEALLQKIAAFKNVSTRKNRYNPIIRREDVERIVFSMKLPIGLKGDQRGEDVVQATK